MTQEPISLGEDSQFVAQAEEPQPDASTGLKLIRYVLDNPTAIEKGQPIDFIIQGINGLQTLQEIQTAHAMLGAFLEDDVVPNALLKRQRELSFLLKMEPAKREGMDTLRRMEEIEKFSNADLHTLNTLTLDTFIQKFVEKGLSAEEAAKEAVGVILHLEGIRAQIIKKNVEAVTDPFRKFDLKMLNDVSIEAVGERFAASGMTATEVAGCVYTINQRIADRRMWLVDDEVFNKVDALRSNENLTEADVVGLDSIRTEFRNAGMTDEEVGDAVRRVKGWWENKDQNMRTEKLNTELLRISNEILGADLLALNTTLAIDSIAERIKGITQNDTIVQNLLDHYDLRKKIWTRRIDLIFNLRSQMQDQLQSADLHALNGDLSLDKIEQQFKDKGMTDVEAKKARNAMRTNHSIYRSRTIDIFRNAKVAQLKQSRTQEELNQETLDAIKREFAEAGMTEAEANYSVDAVNQMWSLSRRIGG